MEQVRAGCHGWHDDKKDQHARSHGCAWLCTCVQVCTHAGHFFWALKSTGGPAGQIGTNWNTLYGAWCSAGFMKGFHLFLHHTPEQLAQKTCARPEKSERAPGKGCNLSPGEVPSRPWPAQLTGLLGIVSLLPRLRSSGDAPLCCGPLKSRSNVKRAMWDRQCGWEDRTQVLPASTRGQYGATDTQGVESFVWKLLWCTMMLGSGMCWFPSSHRGGPSCGAPCWAWPHTTSTTQVAP